MDELADANRRKARVLLLYARAQSRAGVVSDCRNVTACDATAGPTMASEKKASVECARLRDLACGYWKAKATLP
jgi:hypothetical protein